MLNELIRIAEARNFFSLVKTTDQIVNFNLKQCGICMKQNIVNEWIRSIYSKSGESFKVYVNDETNANFKPLDVSTLNGSKQQYFPSGLIEIALKTYNKEPSGEFERYFYPTKATEMKLSVAVAQSEAMQFFLQWQRYRKIWWSSITTSPSLFHLKDITYKEQSAQVEVLAQFPWGLQSVETITIEEPLQKTGIKTTKFESVLTVECALLTLLADGFLNRTKEEYLRLHRTMAPYKLSFVVDCIDLTKKKTLQELAEFMNYRLSESGISTWLSDESSLPIEQQLLERYRLGVPYTVVLTPEALDTGILLLLNSSTTLKEQIHISDLDEYVSKLLKSCFVT